MAQKIYSIKLEKNPNLRKKMFIKIQEAYRTPDSLEVQRKRAHIYEGRYIRITPDYTMKTKRSQSDVIQTLKSHDCHSRLLYPVKLSIIIDEMNKICH